MSETGTTCMACSATYEGLHFCAQGEPDVPQDARSGDSGGFTPATGTESPDLSSGAARDANPLERRCVVCGTSAGVHLIVAPACADHVSPDALEVVLAEARAERDEARRKAAVLREMLDDFARVAAAS